MITNQLKEITIGRKFNLGNYESMEIRATGTVHSSEPSDIVTEEIFKELFDNYNKQILATKELLTKQRNEQ